VVRCFAGTDTIWAKPAKRHAILYFSALAVVRSVRVHFRPASPPPNGYRRGAQPWADLVDLTP
jgi:hypothetical protein